MGGRRKGKSKSTTEKHGKKENRRKEKGYQSNMAGRKEVGKKERKR